MVVLRSKIIPYNQKNIDKFKSPNNMLKHARYIPGKTEGIMIVSGNNLVGYIAWEGNMIIALETVNGFRNKGVGSYLLSVCPANELTVSKSNKSAIEFYENSGWEKVSDLGKMFLYRRRHDN